MTFTWSQIALVVAVALLLVLVVRSGFRARDKNLRKTIVDLCDGPSRPASGAPVSVREASKRYEGTWALASANVDIHSGSIVAVIGGSAAGKSTLLNLMSGAETPTSGDVVVDGTSVRDNPTATRATVGVVAGQPLLYPSLTVGENLRFFAKLFNYNRSETNVAIADALGQVSLYLDRNKRISRLTKEQQLRVAIARSLLHRPGVLLLDEPYADHDIAASLRLDMLLLELQQAGNTVILTSDEYGFDRCFQVADRLLIMKGGRITNDLDTRQTSQAEAELVYRELFEVQEFNETESVEDEDLTFEESDEARELLDLTGSAEFDDTTVFS